LFAPKPDLWERWTANDPSSGIAVDHDAWGDLLEAYMVTDETGLNRFAYGKVTESDRKALHAYLADLRAVPFRSAASSRPSSRPTGSTCTTRSR
jgi:hypothetical protein